MAKGYYFKNIDIFDGDKFFKGSLVTEGAIIKEIGANTVPGSDYEEITGEYLLIPGLINAHTHVPMTLFKNAAEDLSLHDWLTTRIFPLEAKFISAEMCRIAGLWGMAEMLLNGITAFMDMYFYEEDIAAAAREIGIKAVIGEGVINFPAATGRSPEQTLEYTAYLAEKYKNDEYIYVAVAPHSPYLTEEKYLLELNRISEKYNLPFHIHMAETKAEADDYSAKYGKREYVRFHELGLLSKRFIGAHSVWVNSAEIEVMAANNISIAHCPSSNMKLGSGLAPVSAMMKAGVNVMIGTDGSASGNNLDILKEAGFAAKLQKGMNNDPTLMKAEDCLKAVTSNAGKILGGSFGRLVKGGRADMALINLAHPEIFPAHSLSAALLYASSPRSIKSVFVEGRKVAEDGRMLTIDMSALQAEFKKLSQKVG